MMTSIQFFSEDLDYSIRQKNLLRQWISSCIKHEKQSPGNINIVFCSDEYLHKMNIDYLNHDTLTDIITFDNSQDDEISGDLFISLERVRENAKQFSKKLSDELHRVIIHGVLHLCGYGDKTKSEEAKMREMENIYLSQRADKLSNS
jgi:rRNA maturation RNase YbeY